MGLIVILTAATALALLGFILSRPEAEEDWRDQAEGLRQRLERDGRRRSEPQGLPQLVREKEWAPGGETPLVTAPRSSVPSLARAGLAPSPRHHAITGGRNKRCSKSYAKVERSVNWFVCFS